MNAPQPEIAADTVVACRDVTKDFRQGNNVVRALRGVDLDIYAGQLTLLVGPSGCGKTTLLTVMVGMLRATTGTVEVLGEELSGMSQRRGADFRRRNIGFVFQQYNLLPSLTAAENAAVPLIVAGTARRTAVARGRKLLEEMGLGERSHAFPNELSGGQQQRVAIARGLVHEPRLIVCDEPTSALDAASGHMIMELLRNVALQSDRAVVVVTHDPRVFEFGDRIATMEDGKILRIEEQNVNLPEKS